MAADMKAGEAKTVSAETGKADTQWTIGIGLGVFNYHVYPGAKQTRQLILPAPYFTYRSPKFEVDRGIKSFIYNSDTIIIDLSADFGLPVDSDETLARKGMPDLDFVLQVGPSLEFLLNDKNKNYFDARFEIPVRVAFAVDPGSINNAGYLFEPRFTLKHQRLSTTGLSHKLTLGLKFATQEFHAYYYDVAPEFTTAARTEYKSGAGFGGSFANYRLSYKTNDFVYWAFIRYQSLRGAAFEDSPLVLQNDYYFLGVGFSWIFAHSI
jgi:outer membrane scaffolding protein for murein synthesis (MipA/OmpV family)